MAKNEALAVEASQFCRLAAGFGRPLGAYRYGHGFLHGVRRDREVLQGFSLGVGVLECMEIAD